MGLSMLPRAKINRDIHPFIQCMTAPVVNNFDLIPINRDESSLLIFVIIYFSRQIDQEGFFFTKLGTFAAKPSGSSSGNQSPPTFPPGKLYCFLYRFHP